jgi:hypothetical protein
MLLMFVGGIGMAVVLGARGKRQVEPLVERYFKNVEAGDIKAEYDAAASGLKASGTLLEFAATVQAAHAALGPLADRSMQGINVSSNTSGTTITATFACSFAKGNATVMFVFVEEGDEYRLLRVNYSSPLLNSALSCPKCGATTKPGDSFCPSCGEKLPAPAKPPPARPTDPGGTVQEF